MNEIVDALNQQKYFKSLIIHENELNSASIEKIAKLFNKRKPENLESLRLSHCRLNTKLAQELCDSLKRRCFLRKLELVNCNLKENVTALCRVIETNKHIVSLDLSWNSISPANMIKILEVLSKNRKLQSINLSWNSISDQTYSKKA